MPFLITIGDRSWRTDELTLDEAISIEKATGRPWIQLNPFRSAEDLKEVMATFLSRDMDIGAAREKVGVMPLGEVLNGVKVVDDDRPVEYEDGHPKAGDVSSTPGSSNAPGGSDGHRTSPGDSPSAT